MASAPQIQATSFGERLLLLRRRAGLSQPTLGAQVGLTKSAISKLERGSREPSAALVVKLADALNSTPNELLDWRGSPSKLTRAA